MPYITKDKRDVLDPVIEQLHQVLIELELDDDQNNMEGNINYTVTRLLMMVYGDCNSTCYTQINDALGVLDAISKEYYRKVAAPYENQKEFENGPVVRFRTQPEVVGSVDVEVPTKIMDRLRDAAIVAAKKAKVI